MVAPGRASRPGLARALIEEPTPEELESCPFCAGREGRTPPETLALPEREPQDAPGWVVRVVPNLYPAFERQEVVIHSPRHVRSFGELADGEIELVAEAWRQRRGQEPRGYLHALVNEGRAAGASLPHSHSQLVWFRDVPPAVLAEHGGRLPHPSGGSCVIETNRALTLLCPEAGRVPYEMLITGGADSESDAFRSDALPGALALLRSAVRRLRAVEGPVPWNAWLHNGPMGWHLELLPRLTVFAGIELGAGLFVNTLAPEEAAVRLREVVT